MISIIKDYLPWVLSCITIYITILTGNKDKYAWLLGILNQVLWLVWIIVTKNWGLIPMNIALFVINIRNHFKWRN